MQCRFHIWMWETLLCKQFERDWNNCWGSRTNMLRADNSINSNLQRNSWTDMGAFFRNAEKMQTSRIWYYWFFSAQRPPCPVSNTALTVNKTRIRRASNHLHIHFWNTINIVHPLLSQFVLLLPREAPLACTRSQGFVEYIKPASQIDQRCLKATYLHALK